MAKKEIILHGVNVSKCEHFSGSYKKECKAVWASPGYKELHELKCAESPNCYYKKAEYYRQALKDIEEIINTPPDDTRLGKIILRLAEVEY